MAFASSAYEISMVLQLIRTATSGTLEGFAVPHHEPLQPTAEAGRLSRITLDRWAKKEQSDVWAAFRRQAVA